ncbi:MAG: IPT/TIG domain-containing protein [Solirubrobacteraceae bacterium]|jgi:hypothetical protein|nr:IPT/TIG domain-containing protein [Solirubrobacteraceae bacterium]
MPRFRLALPLLALVAFAALSPTAAQAVTLPTITKVSPMKLEVGQPLTIRGKGFKAGKNANTVVFKRDGKAAVFVKAESATTTRITVTVPSKLLPYLTGKGGAQGIQTFRLRVLAKKFGKAFTSKKLSPEIGPPGSLGGGSVAGCKPDPKEPDADSDTDGVSDGQEKTYKTDPCRVDTDQDGISDGFEIESSLDLNSRALPYAGKKPYPNALDAGDKDIDFDGDSLTLSQEYQLWVYTTGGGKLPLTYSDGDQDTNRESADTPANGSPLDMNGNGVLTDDEKDADTDGLANYDESTGRITIGYWAKLTESTEPPFAGAPGTQVMAEPSMTDPDTDGDGLLDGADDQDQDGFPNQLELSRATALTGDGQHLLVNPYNPCLPDYRSRVCTLHPPFENAWAPFNFLKPNQPTPMTLENLLS